MNLSWAKMALEEKSLYDVVTNAISLLTGLTIVNLIINSLCTVVIVHLLHVDFQCSSIKTFIYQTLNDVVIGFVTGAAIFATMVIKDWFIGHVFCVSNVIINNGIIDLTYVRFYNSKLEKCKELSKVLTVFKTTRLVLFVAWLLVLIYCIAVLDKWELDLNRETIGFGAVNMVKGGGKLESLHELWIVGDRRAMITVFFPNLILGLLLIRLHVKAYASIGTPEEIFTEKIEKTWLVKSY